MVMDLSEFPRDRSGAYVIHFKTQLVSRFRDSSTILKIGKAGRSFHEWFSQYNNKNETTIYTGNHWSFLMITGSLSRTTS